MQTKPSQQIFTLDPACLSSTLGTLKLILSSKWLLNLLDETSTQGDKILKAQMLHCQSLIVLWERGFVGNNMWPGLGTPLRKNSFDKWFRTKQIKQLCHLNIYMRQSLEHHWKKKNTIDEKRNFPQSYSNDEETLSLRKEIMWPILYHAWF